MKEPVKVIVVDDNKIFMESLLVLLTVRKDLTVVASYSSGEDLLNSLNAGYADLFLLDIEMPGINGVETARNLNYNLPEKKMIAITMHQDGVFLLQLIEAGFSGFVYKPRIAEDLFTVINEVLNNQFHFPDSLKVSN